MKKFEFEPIGHVNSCFKEKFGIPRQPRLVKQATGIVKLRDEPNLRTAIRSLEGFSHLWLIFVFHEHGSRNWKPSIRPPRLGGSRKVGVLASRSPHRPNAIGISAVTLERIDIDAEGGPEIHVAGVDLLDGTPILDLKPYLPYADAIPGAKAGWAEERITRTKVVFSARAKAVIRESTQSVPQLKILIREILELDPRPAFQQRRMPRGHPDSEGAKYGFKLFEYDVKWEIRNSTFFVSDIDHDFP